MHYLYLTRMPVLEQLQLEEALVRTYEGNLCILNEGSSPAVVLGISAHPDEVVSQEGQQSLPLIRRFSGGGTVVVDENTLFVSFIMQRSFYQTPIYPETLMHWSALFYRDALEIPHFSLQENDYVIGAKKCGGNAQYFTHKVVVHHTTFLWDYDLNKMNYLLHPKKTPQYRQGRSHDAFVTSLKDYLPKKSSLLAKTLEHLKACYGATEIPLEKLRPHLTYPHRKSVQTISASSLIS